SDICIFGDRLQKISQVHEPRNVILNLDAAIICKLGWFCFWKCNRLRIEGSGREGVANTLVQK
ncbi:unnamed protein product, partial [Tenebrio molitor]